MLVDYAKELDEPSIDPNLPTTAKNCEELLHVLRYYRGYALINKNLRKSNGEL